MTRVRLLIAICCAVAIVAIPQSALAVGPVTTPKTLLTEGFETAPAAATYVTTATAGSTGYWAKRTTPAVLPAKAGGSSLYCFGTNASRVVYSAGSGGYATFNLTQTVDYYKPVVSLYYSFPKSGYSDGVAFAPEWATPAAAGVSSALNAVNYPTAVNEWKQMVINLASETTPKTSLSRAAGTFRLRWKDQTEPPNMTPTTGQGVSVDEVKIEGWKFGPVRSLSATTTSISSTLMWQRPWRSYAQTSTEERPLSYRVWRATKGMTDWTELTPSVRVSNPATGTITYSDTTVADGTAYSYAVQAWDPGSGDETTAGYGEHLSIDATTKPFPPPSVGVTSPLAGAVLTGTGSMGIAGTVQAFDGATVSSVTLRIRRSDNYYFDNITGTWTTTPTTYAAAVSGTTWSSAWIPTANDYKGYTYSISVTVTDSGGKAAYIQVTSLKADTVPLVAPVSAVSSPAAGAVVVTTGTFSVSGSASVQSGLPTPTVEVSLAHGANWWNGSAWTTTQVWLPASVTGSSWTLSGVTPPANEYKTPPYVATARATDAHSLTGTSAPRTFMVDSVPLDPPVTTVFPLAANPAPAEPITVSGSSAVAASVKDSPIALASVHVTIEAKSNTGTRSWWNGTGWQSTQTSVTATGLLAWNTTFTSKPNDNRVYTYTIISTATDTHGLSGTSAPVTMSADNVGPRIIAAHSLGRYAIEVRFNEKPFAPKGAGPIDGRYFSARGLRLRTIIGWSQDGTRVRIMTSAQPAKHGSYRVTLRKPVVDALGN